MAAMHDAAGAVATSSGTAALHLALLALGVGPGDEVVIPGYVCTAVLNAVHYVRAKPVLADVDDRTGNIRPDEIRCRLSRQTRAVVVPHMLGCPADVRGCRELGTPVIEDCAQALGATIDGRPVGAFGDIAIFSFYATKVITTGQGGMAIARSAAIVNAMRDLRDYDERDDYRLRHNYGMSDLAAALGRRQLARLDGFIARRRCLAERYAQSLSGLPVGLPSLGDGAIHYRFAVQTSDPARRAEALGAAGVQAKRPVYAPLTAYVGGALPGTERVFGSFLSLPLYPDLSDAEADRVISAAKQCLRAP